MSPFVLTVIALTIGFVVTTFVGHTIHWAIHQKWAGKLNRAHMTHHLALYPVDNLLSDTYRSPGKDNTVFTFLIFAIPFIAIPIVLFVYGVIPLVTLILVLAEIIVVGWMHDYLHDAFHIRGHFLKRFAYFRQLSDLHFAHHVDMQKNFGIFLFWWDRVFATFRPKLEEARN